MIKQDYLRNRTALVTGAGSIIGSAIAQAFARNGATVVLVGRNTDRLDTTMRSIKALGGNAIVMPADVRTKAWLLTLRDNFAIDIFVHGAAAFTSYGPLEQRSHEEIEAVIDTNLTAALRIAAALLPGMQERSYGRFLFIGSSLARLGAANQIIYASAKAGLQGLVRSLAVDKARHGVTANMLELGQFDQPGGARTGVTTPLIARAGKLDEVAAAALYMIAPEADWLRDSVLPLAKKPQHAPATPDSGPSGVDQESA